MRNLKFPFINSFLSFKIIKMKNIYFVIILNFLFINLQAQNFDWTKREGQAAYDYGYGIANDNAGNIYIAGKYEMNANFSGTILPMQGNHDSYVAKYSPAGALTWVRTSGGVSGDYAHALACDGSDYVYVTGEIQGSGTVIKFVGSSITLTAQGQNDVFIAKYDLNGNLLWANKAGGIDDDEGLGITYDNLGNIFVCGFFTNIATFGTTTVYGSGGRDMYVAKYDMNGVFQWVKTGGGAKRDEAKSIKCDAAGNVYICGMYSNGAVFGSQTLTAPNGYFNAFLAKYANDGTLIWVKTAGGDYDDLAWSLTIDNANKIYVTGEFNAYALFNGTPLITTGSNDIFVACYDASGTLQWVKKAGGRLIDRARGIGCDGTNIYITGQFALSANFGPFAVTGVDSSEIFMAKISNAGDFQWVTTVGGQADVYENLGYEAGIAICAETSGNVYATGALLNGGTFGNTSLNAYNRTDVFLSKILQDLTPPQAAPLPNLSVMVGQSASLIAMATGASPLSYQWQKNGINISGAIASSYTITNAQYAHAGQYSVIITNIYGRDTSNAATLSVIPFNANPQATISTPATGTLYHAGDVINFSGSATDAEDGNLTASAFEWRVDFYFNDTNVSAGPSITPGISSGSFNIPNTGNPSATVFYRLSLIVTDSNGLKDTAYVDILPITTILSFNTQPPGLQITFDNLPKSTPFTTTTVEGLLINIGVVSPQSKVDLSYVYSSWQHGGTANQVILVGAGDSSYTAVYNSTGPACLASGTIGREFWANITGYTIADVPVNTLPTSISQLTLFEGPSQAGDNYGSRIRGYICPPITGNYLFWIASDNYSELWLSTDDQVNNKVKIASVSGYTSSRSWTKYPSQQSPSIPLIAGAKYYIEAVHKEGTQGDNLAVGWQLPSGVFERPISGSRLSPFNTPLTVTITSPINNTFFNIGSSPTFQATTAGGTGTVQKVEFFAGTTKIGEDLTSPYSFTWNNPGAGNYSITAKATDNGNNIAVSAIINIAVNTPLTATISAPLNNSTFNVGSLITIQAVTSGGTGILQKIEFFAGTTKLGEDLTNPYSFSWNNASAGLYSLSVKATDSGNNIAVSAVTNIKVVNPLTTAITSPSNNSSFNIGSTITIQANASGGTGAIQKVEFFAGTTKLGEDLTSPYNFIWTPSASGSYALTSKVIDSLNNTAISAINNITINDINQLTVSITSPTNSTRYPSPANITINATSTTGGGIITKMEFFQGTTKIGEDSTAPYSFTWMNVMAGNYALTTKATNNTGQTGISAVVNIIVTTCSTPIITPSGPTTMCSGSVTLQANTGSGYLYQWKKDGASISGATNSALTATVSGSYQVKIIQGSCISWSAPATVKIQSGLSASITPGGPTTFCTGSNVKLYANTCLGYTYIWKKDGLAIPGETSSIYIATTSGNYQLQVTQAGVSAWSSLVLITVNPCREAEPNFNEENNGDQLSDSIKTFQMKVYPNPTTGLFTIELNMPLSNEEKVKMRIVNVLGQEVYDKGLVAKNDRIKEVVELDKSLPSGIYILQVTIGNKVENTNMVLAR